MTGLAGINNSGFCRYLCKRLAAEKRDDLIVLLSKTELVPAAVDC
jgi:hypothetical protein